MSHGVYSNAMCCKRTTGVNLIREDESPCSVVLGNCTWCIINDHVIILFVRCTVQLQEWQCTKNV